MAKTTHMARYTLEFKQDAVRLVEGGQRIAAAAAHSLGAVDKTKFLVGSRRIELASSLA